MTDEEAKAIKDAIEYLATLKTPKFNGDYKIAVPFWAIRRFRAIYLLQLRASGQKDEARCVQKASPPIPRQVVPEESRL